MSFQLAYYQRWCEYLDILTACQATAVIHIPTEPESLLVAPGPHSVALLLLWYDEENFVKP